MSIVDSIKAKTFLAIAIFVILVSPAYGEITLGRWCDKMVPNMPKYNRIMSFVVTAHGKVILKSNFAGGSFSMNELREVAGGIYEVLESPSGDKYRIVPNTGNLQLLDNDGLIRVAMRLENSPQKGECSK